jgi:hypothetical protein
VTHRLSCLSLSFWRVSFTSASSLSRPRLFTTSSPSLLSRPIKATRQPCQKTNCEFQGEGQQGRSKAYLPRLPKACAPHHAAGSPRPPGLESLLVVDQPPR